MSNNMTVGAAMTPAPVTINLDQTLAFARALMTEYNCRHLPVMDEEKLVGIIADRDISLAVEVLKRSADDLLVRSVFVEHPYTASPDDFLHKVLQDMVTLHIGSALVVEEDKLVGIFTTMDACAAFAEFLREAD